MSERRVSDALLQAIAEDAEYDASSEPDGLFEITAVRVRDITTELLALRQFARDVAAEDCLVHEDPGSDHDWQEFYEGIGQGPSQAQKRAQLTINFITSRWGLGIERPCSTTNRVPTAVRSN